MCGRWGGKYFVITEAHILGWGLNGGVNLLVRFDTGGCCNLLFRPERAWI